MLKTLCMKLCMNDVAFFWPILDMFSFGW